MDRVSRRRDRIAKYSGVCFVTPKISNLNRFDCSDGPTGFGYPIDHIDLIINRIEITETQVHHFAVITQPRLGL